MKNILIASGVCVLAFALCQCSGSSSGSRYDLSTPQATIEALFETIRTNDTSAFMNIIATPDDFRSYAIGSDSLLPVRQRRSQKQLDDYVKKSVKDHDRKKYLEKFIAVREDGAADGIKDWKQVKFARASYDRDESNPLVQRYPDSEFTYDEYIGGIRLGTVLIKSSRGWVLASNWDIEYLKMFPKSFEKMMK